MKQKLLTNSSLQKKVVRIGQPFLFIITFSLFLFSCKTTTSLNKNINIADYFFNKSNIEWNKTEEGFLFSSNTLPYNKKIVITKINLSDKNLKININNQNVLDNYTSSINVKTFAKNTNSSVAINTTPFISKNKFNLFSKIKPNGIVINNNKIISDINPKYCALIINKQKDNTYIADIINFQNEQIKSSTYAVGGFWTILEDNKIFKFKKFFDYRSGCAISRDGKILYLFSGTNLSYNECALLLQKLDVYKAMQFDGGTSTHLVIDKKSYIKPFISKNVSTVLGFSRK